MVALETLVVALIVAFAAVYAAWILLPQGLRMRAGIAAGRWAAVAAPMPGFVRAALRRFADSQSRRSSGCAGCSSNKARPPG